MNCIELESCCASTGCEMQREASRCDATHWGTALLCNDGRSHEAQGDALNWKSAAKSCETQRSAPRCIELNWETEPKRREVRGADRHCIETGIRIARLRHATNCGAMLGNETSSIELGTCSVTHRYERFRGEMNCIGKLLRCDWPREDRLGAASRGDETYCIGKTLGYEALGSARRRIELGRSCDRPCCDLKRVETNCIELGNRIDTMGWALRRDELHWKSAGSGCAKQCNERTSVASH